MFGIRFSEIGTKEIRSFRYLGVGDGQRFRSADDGVEVTGKGVVRHSERKGKLHAGMSKVRGLMSVWWVWMMKRG